MVNNDLEFTGERMVPGKTDSALLMEHLARYRFALDYASGKIVLDAACGSGYGTYMLSTKAESVTGIDISIKAIEYCKSNYPQGNAEFKVADILNLPFKDNSFDLVVAFEIFEHLESPREMLIELKRITRRKIMLSTPNADYEKSTVVNPHHVREYCLAEFSDILESVFKGDFEVTGQFPTSKTSGLKKAYMKAKRKLGVGPIFKKPMMAVINPQDLMTITLPYEFKSDNLKNAEFFISMIEL